MTYLIQDLRDQLRSSTAITNDVGEHIYDGIIPQDKTWTRAIVLNLINTDPLYHLRGEAGNHESLVQVDYYTTESRKVANDGAELIRNRLSGYRGTFGEGCYGTCHFEAGFRAMPIDQQDASDLHIRKMTADLKIIHSAAVPTFT